MNEIPNLTGERAMPRSQAIGLVGLLDFARARGTIATAASVSTISGTWFLVKTWQ